MPDCRKHREVFAMISALVLHQADEIADLRHDLAEIKAIIGENISCGRCEPLLPDHSKAPRRSAVTRLERETEQELILDTLRQERGNRTYAAKKLGISLRTLRNKLQRYQGEGLI